MNKEKVETELLGHRRQVMTLIQQREGIVKELDKQKAAIADLDVAIAKGEGIIQALEYVLSTDGFTNIPEQPQVENKDGKK